MGEISSTADQMITVLEHVAAHGPMSVKDIAASCGLNRTVTHRLLNTLGVRGYVRKSELGFVVGPAVLRLVQSVESDLRSIAKPIMIGLSKRLGETVVLHAVDRFEAVVVDQVIGTDHVLRVEHKPGSRHPLHLGASGWAILAFQDAKWLDKFVRRIGVDSGVKERASLTRALGYSISHNELQLDVHGIAAPILEANVSCQASLGILVPASRSGKLDGWAEPLKEAASSIATKLAEISAAQ